MSMVLHLLVLVLAFISLHSLALPSADAASLFLPASVEDDGDGDDGDFAGLNSVGDSAVTKRSNAGVDAWSICPPHMADVDCFYAYLRVYARLRKAAEESDRVSMRNIGKRSAMMTSGAEVSRSNRRKKMAGLCPEELLPAQCFLALRTLYRKLQTSLLNAE